MTAPPPPPPPPSKPGDATTRSNAQAVLLHGTLGVGVMASAVWAFWPLRAPVAEVPSATNALAMASSAPAVPPLDAAVFRAPLWVAPPAPPAPAPPPPPPPPLRLQLVGISNAGGAPSAMIFDPEAGKLLSVRAGERFSRFEIARITLDQVELREGTLLRTLRLRGDTSSGSMTRAGFTPAAERNDGVSDPQPDGGTP